MTPLRTAIIVTLCLLLALVCIALIVRPALGQDLAILGGISASRGLGISPVAPFARVPKKARRK